MSLLDFEVVTISSGEELKSRLASQLDKIGDTQQESVEIDLRRILRGWEIAREESLPGALIYPLRRDPTRIGRNLQNVPEIDGVLKAEEFTGESLLWEIESHAGFDTPSLSLGCLDGRGRAACQVLLGISGLEIFLTRYDQAQGDHGQEGADYFDLLGRPRLDNFNMPDPETLITSHHDCDVAVVICCLDPLVDKLFLVVQEEERESLRDQAMCYLIHHAAGDLSEDVLEFVYEAIKGDRVHVGVHVVDKLLICSTFIDNRLLFHNVALSYASEPSVKLFSVLKRAVISYSSDGKNLERGFEELLKKLSTSKRLPDALLAMETPEHVKSNPEGFIACFIDCHLYAIERGLEPGAWLFGFREAGAIIRICVLYQDGYDRTEQLEAMFSARVNNARFCLGLVLHIFEHLDDGSISPLTARSWYQGFRNHALVHSCLSNITDIAEFSENGIVEEDSGRNMVDNTMKVPDRKPAQRSKVSKMFAWMVRLGWHTEAVEFLTEFLLRKLRLNDPGFSSDIFESLWLPFFAEVFNAYRIPDDANWRRIDPVLKDTFLAVIAIYAVCVVGREPGKAILRRAQLSSRCVCVSCLAINTFLVDGTKTRQLFQVIRQKKNSATRQLSRRCEADCSTIRVSRSALSHILHQLDDADRDCACHIRETKAAGPVLFLQKRDNGRQWRAWSDRREVAKEKMCQFGFLKEILGKRHEVWESLAFLERASPTELLIPFTMDNGEIEARALTMIRQMLREQLGLLRRGRGQMWKNITVSPEGLTIIWL